MMPRRPKPTFGKRLLGSAREAAQIERGELEAAGVTRTVEAGWRVEVRRRDSELRALKCLVCHADRIVPTTVNEAIQVGPDTLLVSVETPVCQACGERYYDRRTMQYLGQVEADAARRDGGTEAGGRPSMPDLSVSDPKIMLGKPVVRGTRITVESVFERLGAGESIEAILEAHPRLTREGVLAAVSFCERRSERAG